MSKITNSYLERSDINQNQQTKFLEKSQINDMNTKPEISLSKLLDF